MNVRLFAVLTFVAAAPGALAQTSTVQAPAPSGAGSGPVDSLQITPKAGQPPKQVWTDRYECYRWAVNQSGFDPANGVGAAGRSASGEDGYRRAFMACLEGRGYAVGPAAVVPPAPIAPAPVAPGAVASPTVPTTHAAPIYVPFAPEKAELTYEPFSVQIEGGYTVTGDSNSPVDDGSNVGLGFTWFPTSNLPVGLRVDGSYSWFRLTNSSVASLGDGYTHGDEYLYGADADLQFDLAHRSSSYKFYLFGGAGWYREQVSLRSVQYEQGTACGYFYCFTGYFPAAVGSQHTTSSWLNSWNAGVGFETAIAPHASFFVEARYLRIGPESSKLDFVPIRLGLRF
jgi:opacity protein-like surface antigen